MVRVRSHFYLLSNCWFVMLILPSVKQNFFENWYHLESKDTPRVQSILKVNPNNGWRKRFFAYRWGYSATATNRTNLGIYRNSVARRRQKSNFPPVTRFLWHGTKWNPNCPLLSDGLHPSRQDCPLCEIVTTTLKRSKEGLLAKWTPSFYRICLNEIYRLGSGIYLTQTSSKLVPHLWWIASATNTAPEQTVSLLRQRRELLSCFGWLLARLIWPGGQWNAYRTHQRVMILFVHIFRTKSRIWCILGSLDACKRPPTKPEVW
jgi:hypothetical protein